jgi:hypothetical protein
MKWASRKRLQQRRAVSAAPLVEELAASSSHRLLLQRCLQRPSHHPEASFRTPAHGSCGGADGPSAVAKSQYGTSRIWERFYEDHPPRAEYLLTDKRPRPSARSSNPTCHEFLEQEAQKKLP